MDNKPHPDCYRPSNGAEGEWFESQFCERCEKERAFWDYYAEHGDFNPDLSCPIHNKGLAGYVPEWIYDEGKPICTEFVKEATDA